MLWKIGIVVVIVLQSNRLPDGVWRLGVDAGWTSTPSRHTLLVPGPRGEVFQAGEILHFFKKICAGVQCTFGGVTRSFDGDCWLPQKTTKVNCLLPNLYALANWDCGGHCVAT